MSGPSVCRLSLILLGAAETPTTGLSVAVGDGGVDHRAQFAPHGVGARWDDLRHKNRDLTELSTSMFSEATYAGIGFGLGFSVTMNPMLTMIPVSAVNAASAVFSGVSLVGNES